jgi:organic radical activating enzyme
MQIVDNMPSNKCMAPWVNIHVGTVENLQPCCAGAGVSHTLDRLPEYFSNTNHDMVAIKKKFLDQQTPSGCEGCQEYNWYSQFANQAPTEIDNFTLLSLDLRWSSTCQLTCMYCNSGQSSAWMALQNKSMSIPIVSNRIRDKDTLIDLIHQHRSTIQRVSLLGGEPLLIKENIKVLDLLPADVEVSIFTGLNVDLDTNVIYQQLINMPNVFWTVSMENVDKKFEFVRRNACWKKQVENIDRLLLENQSRYTVTFQSQFCVYSATSIIELYDFVQDRDIKINWNWLNNPEQLNFTNFPDRLKSISLQQLSAVKSRQHSFAYTPQIDDLIQKIEESATLGNDTYLDECIQWHKDQESTYFSNQMDFQALWPEFSQ